MATNSFSKELSEPTVTNVAPMQVNTGSDLGDAVSALSFGMQVYSQHQQSKQNEQKAILLAEQDKMTMLGKNFATDLQADLLQVENPVKRKLLKTKREAQFLEENRDNQLVIDSYFTTLKGRNIKSASQEAQDRRILQENRIAEEQNKLVLEGKALAVGYSADPDFQALLNQYGDSIDNEEYASLALLHQGKGEVLARKKAELDYNSSVLKHESLKADNLETEKKNEITAKIQTRLIDITTEAHVPAILVSRSGTPQDRIKASGVVARTKQELIKKKDDFLASLSPEERKYVNLDSINSQFNSQLAYLDKLSNPDLVNKASDAIIEQATKAHFAGQLITGSPQAQSVALSVTLGLPIDPESLAIYQEEVVNGKVPVAGLSQTIADVYEGVQSKAKRGLQIAKSPTPTMNDTEVGMFTAPLLLASSNANNGIHDPSVYGNFTNWIDKAIGSPEGLEALNKEMNLRGGDTVDAFLKSTRNYVNGTLAPTLAKLRNEGASGLSLELDGKGNIVLTPDAVRAENFANQNPALRVNLGGVAPAVPQQSNVTAARVARNVSADLNKQLDRLEKLVPDVPRDKLAEMLLNSTKLAFPNIEDKEGKE